MMENSQHKNKSDKEIEEILKERKKWNPLEEDNI